MSRVYPVIHAQTADQVSRNIDVAREAGVDGVFLINHEIGITDLHTIFMQMRARFVDTWIGLNYLGAPEHALSAMTLQANGLWMDNLPTQRLDLGCPVLGGVAFKYQHTGLSLEAEVQHASPLVDVLCTSGPATGAAADVSKVARLRELAPDREIGLASGLTPENVREYTPFVDWLLVATGVGSDFYNLDPAKLASFVEAARS
jgi:uncharacterized protein